MNRKRTKIVATISDKRCEPEFIRELFEAGMDAIRINSAHLNIEGALKIIENGRRVSEKIPFILDTKGPEIRTTVCDSPILVTKGQKINIIGDPFSKSSPACLFVTYTEFTDDVPVGSKILIDDGDVELVVESKDGKILECIAANDGTIGSRKSVNVPKVRFCLPSVSEKDKEFLEFAAQQDLAFIAHSFVRTRQDVLDIQAILDGLGCKAKIIAKIENQEGVDNIDEILDVVYGIMVARGDLAIEIPYEKIPGIQRMIIQKCIDQRKPVIVATQMLHSMISNPRPTRAEVSDIASAIYSQTDALMLSGETANGRYPAEAVRTMTRVALEVESNKEKYIEMSSGELTGKVSAYLAKVAVKTSLRIGARAIIADTVRGRTIRNMAAYRGYNLVLAQCYSHNTMRELAISYGVYPSYQEKKNSVDEFMKIALTDMTRAHDLGNEDIVVVLAGNFSGGKGFSFIEVGTVEYLKDRVSITE
ncbi:MAG: pyruvate kinase [Bacteroidales bacterium]|nr:pyruvate kinase [Bacteroidales bacterium]